MRIRIRDSDFSHARVGRNVALRRINTWEGSPRLRNFLGFALCKTNYTDNQRG